MAPWLLGEQDERKSGNFHCARLGLCAAECRGHGRHSPPSLGARAGLLPRAQESAEFILEACKAQLASALILGNSISQVEIKAALGRLRKLSRSATISAGDLQVAAGPAGATESRAAASPALLRCLLLNFLLWAPAGHAIALEAMRLVSPFFHHCPSPKRPRRRGAGAVNMPKGL